MSLPLKIRS